MLQERIEELGSGILEYKDEKVYVTGFMNSERLEDFYVKNVDCFYSKGIYDNKKLHWGKIIDNALFILINNNKEIAKYQFEVIFKDRIQYKDESNKLRNKTYTIRKCKYSKLYNFIAREQIIDNEKKENILENEVFESRESLEIYFKKRFNKELMLLED